MNNTRPSFREAITSGGFAYGAELVTTRGVPRDDESNRLVGLGEQLLADPRIAWVSITDNPGGHPMLPADWLANRLAEERRRVVIHLTCKDLNRNGLESAAWRYAAEGFDHILALTGDYPVEGYGGLARPVFDLDSVSLIALLHAMNEGMEVPRPGGKTERLPATKFFIGCAVSPFKRHERELMPQYFKLARKIHCGAHWVISQLGYDMRKFYEIKLFLQWAQVRVPIIGNVYVLNRTVARLFHDNKIPGCVVSDKLLDLAEKYATGHDKGRAFFYELAAKQLAVFKGFGFAAGYIGGVAKADAFFQIIEMAEKFAPNDWKAFAREIQFPQPDEFYLFEADPETGLGDITRLNPQYAASLRSSPPNVTLGYRLARQVHRAAFEPGKGLYPALEKIYERLEKNNDQLALRALYRIERVSKELGFGCRDCGDCSLPETAYLCPRRACSKAARNGPCGGSHDGRCELDDKECLWARAYERLKYYGEHEHMLDGPAVFYNASLEGTSSWANFYRHRDHQAATKTAPPTPKPKTDQEKEKPT
ncbi:MAG: methylenetetrahydrofolate reductase C-terminal domain-containing protein [Verrucomicrobiae bacterium]|nr:methylenetetrahydrofolate reductase C-terminal domain-containing protein [Verrucomicrobiae bacterium]